MFLEFEIQNYYEEFENVYSQNDRHILSVVLKYYVYMICQTRVEGFRIK